MRIGTWPVPAVKRLAPVRSRCGTTRGPTRGAGAAPGGVRYGCVVIADTDDLVRGLESPPAHVLLAAAGVRESLGARERATVCEWKGVGPLRRCGRGGCIPITRGRLVVPEARSALPVPDRPGPFGRSRWTVSAWWRSPAASCGGWITWACCRAVQGRTWLLGLVRAGVRRVRHHGGMLPLSMRKELARNTADIEHSEGDRHWSAACATFWHPTRCLSCFRSFAGCCQAP